MTKEILKKICDGGFLDVDDMSVEAKKRLFVLMKHYGMPQSTSYHRFFNKGFDKWEILGVTYIKNSFLLTSFSGEDTKYKTDVEGSRGYGYVLSLDPAYNDSKFFALVTQQKMGVKLCNYMAELGMASQMTVRTRFKADDWKPWELKGIKNILEDFVKSETSE